MNGADASAAPEDEGGWLTAYADLISAILAVVIVLFQQYEARVEAFVETETDAVYGPESSVVFEPDPLDDLEVAIIRQAESLGLVDRLVLQRDRYGLEISVDSVSLFAPDSSRLDNVSIRPLDPIFQVIAEQAGDYRIDLNGHTDDTGSSQRNWQLSSERALALLNYLQARHPQSFAHLRLIALADTQPRIPIDGLTGAELDKARRANRRISLRIHKQAAWPAERG